jgi:cyanophycin synthetase
VNAGPSLPTHLRAPGDLSNRAGEAIARHLYPAGEDGRIPLVGITGCSDTTSVASMLGFLLHLHGQTVGVACGSGTYLGLRCVRKADSSNWSGGQRVLINRTVNVAVLETSPTSLLREGLPYDRCKVGVVTAVSDVPALNRYSVETPAQVAHILRTQIDVVLGDGIAVLNADDPLVLAMAEHADGEVMLYGRDGNSAPLRETRQKGGRVVYLDGDALVFAEGEHCQRHMLAPCVNAADCLPTAAAAWALGVPQDLIVGAIIGYPAALVELAKPVARA